MMRSFVNGCRNTITIGNFIILGAAESFIYTVFLFILLMEYLKIVKSRN